MKKSWQVTCVGLVLVLGVAAMTVLDTKVYEVNQSASKQTVVEKIESDKGTIELDSFEKKPSHVKFIDSDIIEIDGQHVTYGQGLYQVNLSEMTVQEVDGITNIDPNVYDEVLKSAFGLILTKKDGSSGLYHQTQHGDLKRVSSNFIPSKEKSIKLSENGEKLIYLVRESQQMATYSLKTSKKKVVPGKLAQAVLDDFDRNVELSPDGGYFMVFNSEGAYGQHTLNVYGADSGRKYADEIQGTCPKWSPDGKRLSFIYSGGLEDPLVLSNTRVGYMKFPEREIVYFDKVSGAYTISDKMYWKADGTKLVYLRKSNTSLVNEFMSYDVENGSLYSFDLGSANDQVPTNVSFSGNEIVLYWEEDQVMQILDSSGLALSQKERIDTIGWFEGDQGPFMHNPDQLVFYQENKLIIQNENNRELLKIDGLEEIVVSPQSRWVVAGVVENDQFKLKIVSRK